jgi:hypothetical protein
LLVEPEIAHALIDAGCDVHAKDEEGREPLDYAREENREKPAPLLRKKEEEASVLNRQAVMSTAVSTLLRLSWS